jgi:LmbE family N-acetylglucosaminyl deacetylase
VTISLDLPVPGRALAVAAHPDDAEFGAGATLAKWAASGCTILHVVCTDGSKGSWNPDDNRARLIAVRQDEQRAAARALGGRGDVEFLGWPDGELEDGIVARAQLVASIRRFRPDVVIGHDPWKRYRLHPDHRHAGFLTVDAIVAARDPLFFPEIGPGHHRPGALLLFEADQPDHVERAGCFLEHKVSALLAHRSQLRSTMGIDDPAVPDQVEAFRHRITDELATAGRPAGVELGEAFKLMRDL